MDKSNKPRVKEWGGCAILDPEDPTLWIIHESDVTNANRFNLVDIIAEGLRQKIVGLPEGERDGAIAECIADVLGQLRSDKRQLNQLLQQLNDVASREASQAATLKAGA
ncbi:hypothetical protein [Pandoraea sp. ISTKB]|uniref:hypothetical protein n=1 Tax=Pandoraea sp. ISTKB TaxID=1586708 RepID=UPI00084765FA|nr:hypothetical protein [Pandoraea sp. ISTKB]ODP35004.1 hypothetical protein A9762_11605 [Pandoraea sp. ISTKB]